MVCLQQCIHFLCLSSRRLHLHIVQNGETNWLMDFDLKEHKFSFQFSSRYVYTQVNMYFTLVFSYIHLNHSLHFRKNDLHDDHHNVLKVKFINFLHSSLRQVHRIHPTHKHVHKNFKSM